jgi:hypothetical protein
MCNFLIEVIDFIGNILSDFFALFAVVYSILLVLAAYLVDESVLKSLELLINKVV